MNDSDKFQQLGLDDLEEVSGGEALSDRAVAESGARRHLPLLRDENCR